MRGIIKAEEREAIRRAYFIEGKSIRAIARKFHHGRRTVCKAIASPDTARYTLRQPRQVPVLRPYKSLIDQLLVGSERPPYKQRYTGYKTYEFPSLLIIGDSGTSKFSQIRTTRSPPT